jgi:hypothetical protein
MQVTATVIRRIYAGATNQSLNLYNATENDAYLNSQYLSQGYAIHSVTFLGLIKMKANDDPQPAVMWSFVKEVEVPSTKK